MANIIKADMYRIFRSKGFYITIALLILTVILQIVSNNIGTVGFNTTEYDLHPGNLILTGMNAVMYIMKVTDNLLYFLLPLIIIVAAADFPGGTVKNVLSCGVPRSRFYLSKLLTALIFCVVTALVNIIVPFITGTIVNGFGGGVTGGFIMDILKPYCFQVFLLLSMTCVGIFIVFAVKNSAAVIGIYIVFCLLPMILENYIDLKNYDITMLIKMFSNWSAVTANDIVKTLLLGGVYIVASTVGGILIFRRSEIK